MSRPAPSTITPIPLGTIASNRPIQVGQASKPAEEVLVENIHYLHMHMRPAVVRTHFRPDTSTPYIAGGSTSYVVHAAWRRSPFVDFTSWDISALVENTSGVDAGNLRFSCQSDTATYNVVIAVAAGTSAWTEVTGTLTYDASQTDDTIQMEVQNGASGAVRVHAVEIRPSALTTVAAGKTTAGLVPHDTLEVAADLPLSVFLRQRQSDNLQVLRKTRTQTLVAWSEDFTRASASSWSESGSSYVTQAYIPFQSGYGQTSIRWALHGRYLGSSGSVKLESFHDDASQGSEEIALQATWSSADSPPYSVAQHDYTGGSVLSCKENKYGHVRVSLKGDGSAALIFGLSLWFADGT